MRDAWHILVDDGVYTLARRLPVRFDVAARTYLPPARKDRLARQIRQDMWRALRGLRGFSPVVHIVETGGRVQVTAGGAIEVRAFPRDWAMVRLTDLLDDRERRARWIRWAT